MKLTPSAKYQSFRSDGRPRKNRSKLVVDFYGWFVSRIKFSDGCWTWTKGKTANGYGRIWIGNHHMLTHRLAYQLWKGDVPDGLFVLHRCDNPPCCNPDHLFIGTAGDNIRDCHAKGRWSSNGAPGERNQGAKIRAEQVLEIRASQEPVEVLMSRYGLSRGHINKIKGRRIWRHL